MPFENRFITAQRGPTTYRFLGADLKTAKNKVQAKNVSAPVPTPAPIKPPVRPEGDNRGDGREQDRVPGVPNTQTVNTGPMSYGAALERSQRSFVENALGFGLPPAVAAAAYAAPGGAFMLGARAVYEEVEGKPKARARTSEFSGKNRLSVGDQPSQIPDSVVNQMAQATKAPTQNVRTGAVRGDSGGGEGGFGGQRDGGFGRESRADRESRGDRGGFSGGFGGVQF